MAVYKRILRSTWIKSLAVLLIGVALGVIAGIAVDQGYRGWLESRANSLAQALDAQKIATLKSSLTEETGPTYNEIRSKLAAIREVNRDARFVYLMAKDMNGIYFLADSEPESSADHSTNGEQYNNATPALSAMFDSGDSLVEGPLQDDWGTWLSALAPISDVTTHQTIAVIGLDVPATQYFALVTLASLTPPFIVAVLLGFLLVNRVARRRRLETLQFRSELVSIASHELQTPLTGIRWAAETLRRGELKDTQQVLVTSIHNSVSHLEESIEDILQLASIENSARMHIEPHNLTKLFEEVFVTQKLSAERRGVTFAFDETWPAELVISCDALRMRRVFNNLISNAVKYSKEHSVITVAHSRVNNMHCISIKDTGIGIPQKEQEKVFSGFYRASNAVKSEINGTGMGLYLSRAIVEQHGGALWVESVENEGTTVYLSLP